MKSTDIIRNAITSNLPLELAYLEPAVSDQSRTHVAELPAYRPEFDDPEEAENCLELAQLLSM